MQERLPCLTPINSVTEKGEWQGASVHGLQGLTDLEEAGSVLAWKRATCTHRSHLPQSRCSRDPGGTTPRKAGALDALGSCTEALPGGHPTPKTEATHNLQLYYRPVG